MNKHYRILIVDDMPSIHQDFKKILVPEKKLFDETSEKMNALLSLPSEERGSLPQFEIESAYQSREAVNLVSFALRAENPFAVAFIDVLMPPGDDGVHTIEKIWAVDPSIQIVICTAYTKYSWEDLIKRFGVTDQLFALKKPFDTIEVMQLAVSLSKKWELCTQIKKSEKVIQVLEEASTTSLGDLKQKIAALHALNEKLKSQNISYREKVEES
ncbi:MAG: hypothetical protein LW832_09735 [Parachlamydia sp.]|jgi:CheY-like chemotaxis protein|nr:hypothetical protein [Parachlamydia sp.]